MKVLPPGPTHIPTPQGDAGARVLICGAADETMLAVVARILGPYMITVHLIDACPTPLRLSTAYARQHAITLTTAQDTAPALASVAGPFDVVVTDGLLSLLPGPADRAATITRLAQLLTHVGLMLCTTRLAAPGRALEYDRFGRILQAGSGDLWSTPPSNVRASVVTCSASSPRL
jgi:2-polyprenyl-3-methyl-5-hydroxy-6-metoxy-1,4-benzoquinol methylase